MTCDGIMLLTSGVLMLQAEILLPQGEFVCACYQKMAKCKHIMYFGLILGCSEETGKELEKKKTTPLIVGEKIFSDDDIILRTSMV